MIQSAFIYLFESSKQERRQRHSRPLSGCSVAHVITLRRRVMVPFVILASEVYTREACHELSTHGLHNACMQNAAVRFSRQCGNEKAELAPRTLSYSGRLRVPSVSALRCCSVAQDSFVCARFKQCHWLVMRGISDRRLKACCSTGEHVIVFGLKYTWLVLPLQ